MFRASVLKRGALAALPLLIAAVPLQGVFDTSQTAATSRASAAESRDTEAKPPGTPPSPADYGPAGRSEAPSGLRAERDLPSRHPYVVKDMLRFCKPEPGFWVDLGAGRGQLTIPLVEATGRAVLMIDPDAEAMQKGLKLAREKGLQDKLLAVIGVAESLPLADGSVDLLVSRGSIFFWDDQAKGLQEVYRVLRPGGKAMIGGGAGSGYPAWATEKLIQHRKSLLEGDEAEKWRNFVEIRRPEKLKSWAEAAGLSHYTVMGEGAISAADKRVGQGVWIVFEKPSHPSPQQGSAE